MKMLPASEDTHKIIRIISAHTGKQIMALVVEAIQLLKEKYNNIEYNQK